MLKVSQGAAENARQRTQEKDTSVEKGNSRLMSISELTEGPFTRFETQREIVLPLQEHGAREDSVRKGKRFMRIYAFFVFDIGMLIAYNRSSRPLFATLAPAA